MTSPYPPSTVAYPLLNQPLDSLMPLPVSSTSSTFTMTSMPVSSCATTTTTTSLPVSARDAATTTTSTSTLPPISSLMSAAVQTSHPFTHLLLIFLRLLPTLKLSLFCHRMLSLLLPIYNKFLPSASSPTICNNETPAIQNVQNCPR